MTLKKLDFILASRSPRRLQLLAQLSIAPNRVIPADIDESVLPDELPKDFSLRLAKSKATAVARQYPNHIILSADTVVAMGRRIMAKPKNETEAKHIIKKLSGRRCRIYTAMVLINKKQKPLCRISKTRLKLKPLHDGDITNYIKTGEWQDRAGGLALDGLASAWCIWLNGSPTAAIGLDLAITRQLLKTAELLS
ncbi:MAG: Maf family protein [Alphaproteobacteria bacterium]